MSSKCSVGANEVQGDEACEWSACGRRTLCMTSRTHSRPRKRFRSLLFAIQLLLLAAVEGCESYFRSIASLVEYTPVHTSASVR